MKNHFFQFIEGIIIGFLVLTSCEEKLVPYSNEICWLRFNVSPADTSQSYSFVYEGENRIRDTLWIKVKTIGNVTNHDRKVTFTQIITDTINAEPNLHYVDFDNSELADLYVIPANKTESQIPVILKRDKSLQRQNVLLKFSIGENSDFKPGFVLPEKLEIWITDQVIKPANWSEFVDWYIGPYDKALHQFLIEASGEKWDYDYLNELGLIVPEFEDDWPIYTNDNYDEAYFTYLIWTLQKALKEENERRAATGLGPLMRDDNTVMTIGD
ncbi:DUF4843 domain-containing protein [Limibacterium fermenti]|uniref:DUF4843 domain-containing protein n=1 Tax=Limibacterium fermenti TaxID=3229863 RepID=UPI003A751551